MTRAEQYRARAEEAERRGAQVRNADVKRAYFEIARQWREMADQAERQGLD